MKFEEGTDVKLANGDKVGTVDHIVVDPGDNQVSHIIVKKGFLFTEDRVVPVEALREADDEDIILESSVEDIEKFPKYEEEYYVSPRSDYQTPTDAPWYGLPMYYYPPVGTGLYPSTYGYAGTGTVERTMHNIPSDTIVVEEGMKVTTINGEHAGDVEETFTDNEGNLTHILISKGFIFTTERLVPLNWVKLMTDDEIRLSVPTEVVEDLPEYSE